MSGAIGAIDPLDGLSCEVPIVVTHGSGGGAVARGEDPHLVAPAR